MTSLPNSDWLVVVFLSYFAIKNIKKEFLSQLVSILGWGLTYYTVPQYTHFVIRNQIFNFLSEDYQELACKATVFCITIILFDFLATLFETSVGNKARRSVLINLFVVFIGFVKGSILLVFVIHLLDTQNIHFDFISSSKIIPYIQHFTAIVHHYIDLLLKLIFH